MSKKGSKKPPSRGEERLEASQTSQAVVLHLRSARGALKQSRPQHWHLYVSRVNDELICLWLLSTSLMSPFTWLIITDSWLSPTRNFRELLPVDSWGTSQVHCVQGTTRPVPVMYNSYKRALLHWHLKPRALFRTTHTFFQLKSCSLLKFLHPFIMDLGLWFKKISSSLLFVQ